MTNWLRMLLAGLLLTVGAGARAEVTPSPEFRARAEALVQFFNLKQPPTTIFSPAFLSQVPAEQLSGITAQVRSELGDAKRVAGIEARAPTRGKVSIQFDKGVLQMNMAIGEAPPHLVEGLLITGSQIDGDSLAAVAAEIKALPGASSFAVARLGGTAPDVLASHDPERALAIGSAFKLFILGELARSVKAGERKWTDVAKLDRRSLPSGFLQGWPKGAPLTLYSLAALMISQSDNTATDTLLHLLGRKRVEAAMAAAGVKAPERNRPFLSTIEAFALKGGKDADARKSWPTANEAQKRAILAALSLDPAKIDPSAFRGAPNMIDSAEWFASAEDLVRTMDWLRRTGGAEALDILAINPGIGSGAAARHSYVGYKGGSEQGVINMTFLVRNKAGSWHTVTGSWNNPAAAVDDPKFVALMTRAIALIP